MEQRFEEVENQSKVFSSCKIIVDNETGYNIYMCTKDIQVSWQFWLTRTVNLY